MPIQKVKSLHAMIDASNEALATARAAGFPAYLVVPSHAWAQARKLQLSKLIPTGIDVLTFPQLIDQLWELYGDGTTVVAPQERSVLLRPLVGRVGLLSSSPSPGFIQQLACFAEEAIYPGLQPSEPLSESQSKVMELISMYEAKLAQEGLVELAQAGQRLVQDGCCVGMHLVFEAPDLHSFHVRQFIAAAEHIATVHVLEERLALGVLPQDQTGELAELRRHLFTGVGGMRASGHVHVGEAAGVHAAGDVIVKMVQQLHRQDGIDYQEIFVGMANPADAYPRLHDALARAGIPFVTQFSIICARTGLGAAFTSLDYLACAKDDDEAYAALVDLISSPYSGVSGKDARALQMRWREQAHATHDQRIHDIFAGFDQGNATAAQMRERLLPLANLLDSSREDKVRALFEHARAAHVDVETLIDDSCVAETLLDYLELCQRFSCEPDRTEMANLSVSLTRSYGDPQEAVIIGQARQLGPSSFEGIVMTGLDSLHYPMANPAGTFDALMSKLGIERADTLAIDQRAMLLNVIESSGKCFAFTRATHDAQGDECCQSALFEELVGAYRSQQEDEEGLAVHAVPAALESQHLVVSEADALFGEQGDAGSVSIVRGKLEQECSNANLMAASNGQPLVFSPTALEDYYRCPYRWFTSRRVGYNSMDVSFDAAAMGNLVHASLERFYRAFLQAGYTRVTPENLDEALQLASTSFDAQVKHDVARDRRGLYLRTKSDEYRCEELRDSMLALVKRDATFLPGFAPTYFEFELGHDKEQILQYAGVPVRGKVDRIDINKDGEAIIIDYKLSGLSSGYGFAKGASLPERIQTDIYATIVERQLAAQGVPLHVIGSVYRSYSSDALRGVYKNEIDWGDAERTNPACDAMPHEDSNESYQEYLAHVEQVVTSCMNRLRQGDIAPNPISNDTCDYCKGRAFCPRGGA